MIPGFEGRLARLDAAAVLAEYLGPRFEGVGKRLVVTVADQGAVQEVIYSPHPVSSCS
jgi:hypothetical protein